ncbi:MAG: acylphosphatase [Planctomycetota bacterium]|nr:acylphosphatase [Planctomycetota bacterium]
MSICRRRVHYVGRVQGVGFRARARMIASRHAVAGWVRNLDDGGVELVVEGEERVVLRFLDEVARDLGRYIAGVEATDEVPTDPPDAGFVIRY